MGLVYGGADAGTVEETTKSERQIVQFGPIEVDVWLCGDQTSGSVERLPAHIGVALRKLAERAERRICAPWPVNCGESIAKPIETTDTE